MSIVTQASLLLLSSVGSLRRWVLPPFSLLERTVEEQILASSKPSPAITPILHCFLLQLRFSNGNDFPLHSSRTGAMYVLHSSAYDPAYTNVPLVLWNDRRPPEHGSTQAKIHKCPLLSSGIKCIALPILCSPLMYSCLKDLINEQLLDGREWLFDTERPGLADISVYFILSWIKTWVKNLFDERYHSHVLNVRDALLIRAN